MVLECEVLHDNLKCAISSSVGVSGMMTPSRLRRRHSHGYLLSPSLRSSMVPVRWLGQLLQTYGFEIMSETHSAGGAAAGVG